ncbi:MAG: hypothetical protein ACLP5H_22965 [Desulfomonilaceae bacterium]
MKARIIKSIISTGSVATDFIRLVCGRNQPPVRLVDEDKTRDGATELLEVFRNHRRKRVSDYILTGQRVITAMDEQLRDYRSAGEQFADWVTRGCSVGISGDDRRFTVIEMCWEEEAIRVRSDEGQDYVIPFSLIGPWPKESEE